MAAHVVRRAAAALGAALVLVFSPVAPAATPPTTRLEQEKLRQEIRQLQLENREHTGVRGFLSSYGGLLAGFAALGTALVALTNLVRQRNADRLQRQDESIRRLEERFSSVLADLGSTSEAVQAAAAVSLLTFLRPEHRKYHRQVRLVALANLKVRPPGPVTALIVRALSDALRTDVPIQSDEVDFAGAELTGINLAGLDLRSAVLRTAQLEDADLTNANLQGIDGYKAGLKGARLTGVNLREAHLDGADARKAVFHRANLNAVKFQQAILTEARFESASLQSAHLENAHLEGARFHNADVNDAYIRPATYDQRTLEGLSRARNRWEAKVSPEIEEQLRKLENARKAPGKEMPPNPDRSQRGVAGRG